MKRNIFNVILIFNLTFASLFSLDIDRFFNNNNSSDVVYYDASSIDTSEYSMAENIRAKYLTSGDIIYSVAIADILPNDGNEIIILLGNELTSKIIVYSSVGVNLFNYKIDSKFDFLQKGSILEIDSFYDDKKKVNIIKYYNIYESEGKRDIDLYIFRIDDDNIKFLLDFRFYQEITSGVTPVKVILDNIFVDIDKDDMYEILIESTSKVIGREDKVNYQVYKYNHKTKEYICVVSEWFSDDIYSVDYSSFFQDK